MPEINLQTLRDWPMWISPDGRARVIHADCRDALPLEILADCCVCDPPYDLTANKRGGRGPKSANPNSPAGRSRIGTGFMGKPWDGTGVAFDPATWAKVLDSLKPGAMLLAFGGTRTYHRMTCAIEDAGFEIRDCLQWIYGQGFPKSLDISKAIDKARTEDSEPIRCVCRFVRSAMDLLGLKSKDLVQHFDNCNPRLIDHWAARDTDSQPFVPTWEQWIRLKQVLGMKDDFDDEVWRLNKRKGQLGDNWNNANVIGSHDGVPGGFGDYRFKVRDNAIREPSDAAKQWQGWGTALKPAYEPIVLAMKPLDGTFAENALKHGVAGLNIDGGRIAVEDIDYARNCSGDRGHNGTRERDEIGATDIRAGGGSAAAGRWPANVILDEAAGEILAAQAGPQKSGGTPKRRFAPKTKDIFGEFTGAENPNGIGSSSGNVSRFFYCAKAGKSERNGSAHPTIKPLALMRYLCRLIAPPGGLVLDPFAGSGTTLEAAVLEGFNAIGIEQADEYLPDIQGRLIGAARSHRHQADQ